MKKTLKATTLAVSAALVAFGLSPLAADDDHQDAAADHHDAAVEHHEAAAIHHEEHHEAAAIHHEEHHEAAAIHHEHEAWSHDQHGYWDDQYAYHTYVLNNNHHGYWRRNDSGVNVFFNID